MKRTFNRRLTLAVLASGLILAWPTALSAAVQPAVAPVAELFSLQDVRLLESPFKTAMELNAQYLLTLDPDRLLSRVRGNAGLAPKAPSYGGWESEGVAGHSLGHYLTALAQQYRATGDRRFLDRVTYIVSDLAVCQARAADGFISGIPNARSLFTGLKQRGGRIDGWAPWYTMHKLFAGLRDAWQLCGNEQAETVLVRLADWADSVTRDLTPQEMETMLGAEHGGMAEVLADVYVITSEPRHLGLARRFCHRLVMDPLARGEDRLDGLHANTQIPKITGAARLYEVTGEDYFRRVAETFWDIVVTNRTYVIGGNSDSEYFFPAEQTASHLSSATCETCNTYNMLKLTEHLFAVQPAGRWMDYYERALYNQILGSQDPGSGMFTYFQPLKPGGFKIYSNPTNAFWCCVGTGMENHTKYGAAIYGRGVDALWVNLFIPSELNWTDLGVKLRQETPFPEGDTTDLTVSTKGPIAFALKIRAPAWLAGPMTLRVNGQAVPVAVKAGYATINRLWHDGDRVQARLPMAVRTEPLPHTTNVLAFLYGPIVLVAELGTEGLDTLELCQSDHNENLYRNLPGPAVTYFVADGQRVADRLEPVAARPLTFQSRHLAQPHEVSLVPFWRMHRQRYTAYFETFTPAQWERKRVALAVEEAARKAFEARIVDEVKPGEQQSETDHSFKGEHSFSGGSSPKWRDARDGGWFEYTVKTLPDRPLELRITYFGSDGGNREFELLADGERFATEKLTAAQPNEMIEKAYPIPPALTRGKAQLLLRFQPEPGNIAGGIFGLRVVKPPAQSGSAE